MAITTRDQLIAGMAASNGSSIFKASITSVAGFYYTTFRSPGQPASGPAIPATTGSQLSRTTQGAILVPAPSGTSYFTSYAGSSSVAGSWIIADRLVEFGGLSGITTTAQSVSAVALPARATGATDVQLWLEIFTLAGTTASATVTASYTNQSGTSGRTATLIGGIPASGTPASRTYPFTLQATDTGVSSVESFTSTTSTTVAGSLGLILRRPLLFGSVNSAALGFTLGYAETAMEQCPNDACLELMCLATTTSTGVFMGSLSISQG